MINAAFEGRLKVRRFCRETGRFLGEHEERNTITSVAKLVDLIDGTASDHVDTGADLEIRNESDTLVRTLTTANTIPSASGLSVTIEWEDNTTQTYVADDFKIKTNGGTEVAEVLNKNFGTKPTTENWHYLWTLSISGSGLQTAGGNLILDLITGNSSSHLNQSNTRFEVWDNDTGGAQVSGSPFAMTTQSQPASNQLRYVCDVLGGTSRTWQRVVLRNHAVSVQIWEDTSPAYTQGSDTDITYTLTLTLS